MFKQRGCDKCGGRFYGPTWHTRCRQCFDPRTDCGTAAHEQEVRKFLKQSRKKRDRRRPVASSPTKAPRAATKVGPIPTAPLVAFRHAPRRQIGYEDLVAIEPRPCTACLRLVNGECQHHGRKMAEPSRPCRCVHFVSRTQTHRIS